MRLLRGVRGRSLQQRTPDGHLCYALPEIRTAASNRLGLIVTRLGAQESLRIRRGIHDRTAAEQPEAWPEILAAHCSMQYPSNNAAASRILASISTSNGQRSMHTPHSTQAEALTGNPAYHSLICSIPLAGT